MHPHTPTHTQLLYTLHELLNNGLISTPRVAEQLHVAFLLCQRGLPTAVGNLLVDPLHLLDYSPPMFNMLKNLLFYIYPPFYHLWLP